MTSSVLKKTINHECNLVLMTSNNCSLTTNGCMGLTSSITHISLTSELNAGTYWHHPRPANAQRLKTWRPNAHTTLTHTTHHRIQTGAAIDPTQPKLFSQSGMHVLSTCSKNSSTVFYDEQQSTKPRPILFRVWNFDIVDDKSDELFVEDLLSTTPTASSGR